MNLSKSYAVKSLQSCPILCDPTDGSPPGSPSLGFPRQEHWSGVPFPSPMHESEKWKWSRSVMSDPQWPHGLQPTRLLHPWDFPGKSAGVGCHCLQIYLHTCTQDTAQTRTHTCNTHTYIKRTNSIDFFHVYLKVNSKLLIINSDHSLLEIETNVRWPELKVKFQGTWGLLRSALKLRSRKQLEPGTERWAGLSASAALAVSVFTYFNTHWRPILHQANWTLTTQTFSSALADVSLLLSMLQI